MRCTCGATASAYLRDAVGTPSREKRVGKGWEGGSGRGRVWITRAGSPLVLGGVVLLHLELLEALGVRLVGHPLGGVERLLHPRLRVRATGPSRRSRFPRLCLQLGFEVDTRETCAIGSGEAGGYQICRLSCPPRAEFGFHRSV